LTKEQNRFPVKDASPLPSLRQLN